MTDNPINQILWQFSLRLPKKVSPRREIETDNVDHIIDELISNLREVNWHSLYSNWGRVKKFS
jgi:hypothetical protein